MTAACLMDLARASLRTLWISQAVDEIAVTSTSRRRMFHLAARIAAHYGLTVDDFRSPIRRRPIAWPRQEFMLAAHEAGFSMPQIGRFLGRDHTTILHGIRAARKRRQAAE
jgi:chromosomal replication initiation ATPase DnaA